MLAFVNSTVTKSEIITQLKGHFEADEIIKGIYWQNGKGCAIGCTIHGSAYDEYESRFGIPRVLASLEDRIFDGLSDIKAKEWPLRFMMAVNEGSDLSMVGLRSVHWLLTDAKVNPGIEHELVKESVAQCANILLSRINNETIAAAAVKAAEATAKKATRAAFAAGAHAGAQAAAGAAFAMTARAGGMAEGASEWAMRAGWIAEGAAEWAALTALPPEARPAGWMDAAAAAAAEATVYESMADKLIGLIESAPIPHNG